MSADARRLFFALWPTPEIQERMAEAARSHSIRGRLMRTERLHMTLLFLGDVDAGGQRAVTARIDGIEIPAFHLRLARLGHFRGPGVAWMAPVDEPAALLDLVGVLRDAAESAGLERETRRFKPHVTLARRAQPPRRQRLDEVIEWPVRAFSLTESTHEAGRAIYRDIARWPLRSASR